MDVVFDTNILVMSQMDDPAKAIMQTALSGMPEGQLSFFYSPAMLAEYAQALTRLPAERPEIFNSESIAQLLRLVEERGHLVHPTIHLSVDDPDACTHEPDNRFLECALAAQADYLVTDNKVHFPTHRKDIAIVGPSEFESILFADMD